MMNKHCIVLMVAILSIEAYSHVWGFSTENRKVCFRPTELQWGQNGHLNINTKEYPCDNSMKIYYFRNVIRYWKKSLHIFCIMLTRISFWVERKWRSRTFVFSTIEPLIGNNENNCVKSGKWEFNKIIRN